MTPFPSGAAMQGPCPSHILLSLFSPERGWRSPQSVSGHNSVGVPMVVQVVQACPEPVPSSAAVPLGVCTRRAPQPLVGSVRPHAAGNLPSSSQQGVRTWVGAGRWDRTPAEASSSCRNIGCPGCKGVRMPVAGSGFVNWSGRWLIERQGTALVLVVPMMRGLLSQARLAR